jgi:hypothetical protein
MEYSRCKKFKICLSRRQTQNATGAYAVLEYRANSAEDELLHAVAILQLQISVTALNVDMFTSGQVAEGKPTNFP